MSLPVVAIVGRPNVGKSSLLNCLARRRIAIVDATPGVTRDRVSAPVEIEDRLVELVDTGGMGIEDTDRLGEHVEAQIDYALAEADLVVFLVDAREGITALDRHVAQRLRRRGRPVLLVANKVDHPDAVSEIGELPALGFGDPIAISAIHSQGITELIDRVRGALEDLPAGETPEPAMKLAIVGKRNAGKSTLLNSLAGRERVIVSETPGTTRDSVDVTVELDGRRFVLIDTAGIRKRRSLAGDIEFYSQHRAMRSIRRADVVAMLIDASVPVSQVDKSLAGEIAEHYKPAVFVVNKWDLAGEASPDAYGDYLARSFPELDFAPVSLTVATTGENVPETLRLSEQLFEQARTRVPTGRLNEVIEEITAQRGPSHRRGTRPPKILYASQVGTEPPTIVCFVNDVRSFDESYRRFLVNQLRERVPFAEVPIRLFIRQRRGGREQTG